MSTLTAAQPSRRDFIQVSTAAMAVAGVAAIAWPLIDQMNPDSTTEAFAAIEVDLSAIAVGQIVSLMVACVMTPIQWSLLSIIAGYLWYLLKSKNVSKLTNHHEATKLLPWFFLR